MKNLFFSFLAVLILSAGNVAFGQMSNTEVLEMIQKSAEFNKDNAGVLDPSKIWPGQILTYFFEDGTSETIVVEDGDNQWTIVQNKLSKLREIHGEVVEPIQEKVQPEPNPEPVVQPKSNESDVEDPNNVYWKPGWLDLFIAILVVAALYIIVKALTDDDFRKRLNQPFFSKREKVEPKFSENPATEGPAFVEGGIQNEQQAGRHFVELVRMGNPDLNPSNIIVKEKKRVYISTMNGEAAVVEFANGTSEEMSFRNTPGWQAMVSVDGGKSFQRELFFADCGNPIYGRTSMKDSGLIVTDEPIDFGDEVINSATETIKKIDEVEKVEKLAVEKRIEQSDEVMIVNDHAMVADEFLKTQRAHKVTMNYTKDKDGNVTISSVFETKNEPASPKEEVKKVN